MKKEYILLFVILFFAAFLRFWQISSVPPGAHTDEAMGGYNAYSLLKTGLDPHGQFNLLGISDSNIGGTIPPLYTYFLIPLVKLFDLNIFIIRFPSVVFGIFSVFLVYLIGRKVFKDTRVILIATCLSAFNPWMIHISRQGLLEAISLFFVLLGVMLFLYAKEKKVLLFFSSILFGLSLFAYDAPKVFLPLFLILLAWYQKDVIIKARKLYMIFLIVFAVFYLVYVKVTFFGGEIEDFNRSSIFSSVAENVDSERYVTKAPLWASSIFHNKLTVSLKRFETSYVSIFSINWFFINGSGNLQHSVGNHGEFYLFELPFFFIGIYILLQKNKRLAILLLGWMLIGALPGGLTTGNYAYRSIHVLPVPILFSAYGIGGFLLWLKKFSRHVQTVVKIALVIVIFIFVSSYLFTYFFDYPAYASESWNTQQNDAIRFVISQQNKYEKVFVDGGEPWAITYAYLNKTDPKIYQNAYQNQKMLKGVKTIIIGNVFFGMYPLDTVSKPSDYFPKNSLIVTNAVRFPSIAFIKTYNDPGGIRAIFKIFSVQ